MGTCCGFGRAPSSVTFLAAVRPFVDNIEEMRHYDVIFDKAPASTEG